MTKKKPNTTPLMEQYLAIKAEHRDAVLLYRMGDFYETFYDDAKTISRILGIALTKRAHGKSADVPLAGFPYHALDNYLYKLVQAGHRVAICEQVEDPKQAKGVVKREVIEIVTPGATLSEKLLDNKNNNFLAAVQVENELCGLALIDVSTGEFYCGELSQSQLRDQLLSFHPREILIPEGLHGLPGPNIDQCVITRRDDWIFNFEYANDILLQHFKTHSLKGFGLTDSPLAVTAGGAVLNYLQENYKTSLDHIREIRFLNLSDYMVLDDATRRNLEIKDPIRENIGGNTLVSVVDETHTPMGGRLIRQWMNQPLRDASAINERLDLVEELVSKKDVLDELESALRRVSDLERLIGKIVTGRANARDLLHLRNSLQILPEIHALIVNSKLEKITTTFSQISGIPHIVDLISAAIKDEPPLTITDGGIIRHGYDDDLDELLDIARGGKDWLLKMQENERIRTGIHTLKVKFNKVFGYYIEITKTNLDRVPEDYIRKQTLVNAERFITPELKEQEEKILGAEDRLKAMEYEIFQKIREKIMKETAAIQNNSMTVAYLDCIASFARAALENRYVRPLVDNSHNLEIVGGRHPVVEKFMRPGEEFIANDVHLDPRHEQIWIITGPNMAGKSTFLRQVGLIVFMAQTGCFVPAEKATIGTVDRIFTRVGASDNLASGESTFLVEMNETANILNNATDRSLVLLDEIGRGTSTFDGLSIAWSVAEYLHQHETVRAKTLFATHYHELTELELLFPRIKNYNVAVEEWEEKVIFLRKIVAGGTDNSYGIYVAQMAGLPTAVIERAREILSNLEANELSPNKLPRLAKRQAGRAVDQNQMSLFEEKKTSPLEQKLKKIDINNLTPVDALNRLNELKKLVGD